MILHSYNYYMHNHAYPVLYTVPGIFKSLSLNLCNTVKNVNNIFSCETLDSKKVKNVY